MLLCGAEINTIIIGMKECGYQMEFLCCGHGTLPHLRRLQNVAEFQRYITLFGARHAHGRVRRLQHDRRAIACIRVPGLKNGAIPIIAGAQPQLITGLANAGFVVAIIAVVIGYWENTKVEFVTLCASCTPSVWRRRQNTVRRLAGRQLHVYKSIIQSF